MQRTQYPPPKTIAQSIARKCQQPRCPSNDEWIVNKWNIYTVEFYSALKEQETTTLQTSE